MNERQLRALRAYRKVHQFLIECASPITPEIPSLHAELQRALQAINQYGVLQVIAVKVRSVAYARRELEIMREKQMIPLAKLARPVFRGEHAIVAALVVPHKRAAPDKMLVAAEAMVRALRPHLALLDSSAVESRRVTALSREMRRLKKVVAAAYTTNADRGAPTNRLPALFDAARSAVERIDVIVRTEGTTDQVAGFRTLRRVGKRIGRPPKKRGPG